MAKLKYVMFECNGNMLPVLFPELLVHRDVAFGVEKAVAQSRYNPLMIGSISAGFVTVRLEGNQGVANNETLLVATAYGESESLGLKSEPEDSEIITKFLRNS